ncbi:hypothetical protein MHUMG1_01411 [Metarhizium humberi]|uniref:Uncharacterized protein n=1 Tax=Metarhizium humberi TaxID=2596975 RepID=A0A9P8ML10_9HYPO|nr:hypothetical protein MHUMG1_01411 [Metarhizium humberi]
MGDLAFTSFPALFNACVTRRKPNKIASPTKTPSDRGLIGYTTRTPVTSPFLPLRKRGPLTLFDIIYESEPLCSEPRKALVTVGLAALTTSSKKPREDRPPSFSAACKRLPAACNTVDDAAVRIRAAGCDVEDFQSLRVDEHGVTRKWPKWPNIKRLCKGYDDGIQALLSPCHTWCGGRWTIVMGRVLAMCDKGSVEGLESIA